MRRRENRRASRIVRFQLITAALNLIVAILSLLLFILKALDKQ